MSDGTFDERKYFIIFHAGYKSMVFLRKDQVKIPMKKIEPALFFCCMLLVECLLFF